ncbi:hypothetical protein [Ekhidna sp.]|uniref:hypothetical protein n=1 Tax=Ekhidna sp. TaxID=2608089 RepID=UPI003519B94C
MKYPIKVCVLLISITFAGCGNNSEDPGIDCGESDLSIQVVSSVKSDCDQPGSITVAAEGGEGGYSYSIDETAFQDSGLFTGLFAGKFKIYVRDEVGCVASTSFTLESEPTGITLNLETTSSDCSNNTGTITINANGGVGELLYSLDGGEFSSTTMYSNVSPENHEVTARDEEGCEVKKAIRVMTNVSLNSDIMPIISNECSISGCHNGSQSPRLMTQEEVRQNASRVKSETQSGSMPRDGSLSQTEIDLIACWVDDGALNN